MRGTATPMQSGSPRSRASRRVAAVLSAVLLIAGPAVPGRADDGGGTSVEQAAKEIADAREAANKAADAMFAAESKFDQLQIQQAQLQAKVASLQAQVAKLRSTIEGAAVNRFTRSGTNALPLLTGFRSVGDQAQVDVLMGIADETSDDDFDQYDVVSAQLADAQRKLGGVEAQTVAAKADFAAQRDAAIAEVAHLKTVEAGRLQDEAVRKAVQAREAELLRIAAAQTASVVTTVPVISTPTADAVTASTFPGDLGGDLGGFDDEANTATGGAGGGQTGAGGLGARPGVAQEGLDYGGPDWMCPVQGPVSFGDTWGAPRSGGRRHEGVDMIGERGLPVVAVVDGFAQSRVMELGGLTIEFTGVDGNRYFYGHLDSWASLGQVSAGTVIGYLGQTGNAQQSVPHLHFEIHPGGGPAVNPYPTVRAHCV